MGQFWLKINIYSSYWFEDTYLKKNGTTVFEVILPNKESDGSKTRYKLFGPSPNCNLKMVQEVDLSSETVYLGLSKRGWTGPKQFRRSKIKDYSVFSFSFLGILFHNISNFSLNKWENFPPYSDFSWNKWKNISSIFVYSGLLGNQAV